MYRLKYEKRYKYFLYILYAYLISSIIFPSSENYGNTDSYGFKRIIPQMLSALIVFISSSKILNALKCDNSTIKHFYYFALYTFFNFY